MQLPEAYKHIIVMEFESEEALKKYAGSPAQKQWYEVLHAYPRREQHARHYQLSGDGQPPTPVGTNCRSYAICSNAVSWECTDKSGSSPRSARRI